MKYLFLIIRHCFPRARWRTVGRASMRRVHVTNPRLDQEYTRLEQVDQFGNIRFITSS